MMKIPNFIDDSVPLGLSLIHIFLDYPRIDLSKNGIKIDINSLVLKNIISQTKFAASDKEHKPILTGINFKATNNQLECTATDSYRLAKKVVSDVYKRQALHN